MKIIGLTGGIGSGKSTVLNLFQKLGTDVYIADFEAKKLLNSDVDLKNKIIESFGVEAYKNNHLDRAYMASIVFKDTQKLEILNQLVHPKVKKHFREYIKKSTSDIIIYEAAILFESGSYKLCDFIITVTANYKDKIKRIMKRDNVSKQQILDRMKHQLDDEFKIKNSNFVIRNNCLNYTKSQVSTIYDLVHSI